MESFNRDMLRASSKPNDSQLPKKPAPEEANSLLQNIKDFRRDSLKRAEIITLSERRESTQQDGFLGALLGAMRRFFFLLLLLLLLLIVGADVCALVILRWVGQKSSHSNRRR